MLFMFSWGKESTERLLPRCPTCLADYRCPWIRVVCAMKDDWFLSLYPSCSVDRYWIHYWFGPAACFSWVIYLFIPVDSYLLYELNNMDALDLETVMSAMDYSWIYEWAFYRANSELPPTLTVTSHARQHILFHYIFPWLTYLYVLGFRHCCCCSDFTGFWTEATAYI